MLKSNQLLVQQALNMLDITSSVQPNDRLFRLVHLVNNSDNGYQYLFLLDATGKFYAHGRHKQFINYSSIQSMPDELQSAVTSILSSAYFTGGFVTYMWGGVPKQAYVISLNFNGKTFILCS